MLIYLVILWWLAEFVEHITYPSAANLRIHTLFFLISKRTHTFSHLDVFGASCKYINLLKETVVLAIFSRFDMLLIDCGIRRGYFWSPDI